MGPVMATLFPGAASLRALRFAYHADHQASVPLSEMFGYCYGAAFAHEAAAVPRSLLAV